MSMHRYTTENETGQGMVEFALTLTLLLLLIFGIIEFGRFIFVYSAVFSGAREAARYGAASGVNPGGKLYYQDCAEIRASAIRVGLLAGLEENDITIQYDNGPHMADNIAADCPVGGVGPGLNNGDRIIVNVSVAYQPFTPLGNFPSIPITSTVARTIITNVPIR